MYRNNVETGGSLIVVNNNSSDFPMPRNNFLTSLEADRFAAARAKTEFVPRQDEDVNKYIEDLELDK